MFNLSIIQVLMLKYSLAYLFFDYVCWIMFMVPKNSIKKF